MSPFEYVERSVTISSRLTTLNVGLSAVKADKQIYTMPWYDTKCPLINIAA